jgi:hypothetical protein
MVDKDSDFFREEHERQAQEDILLSDVGQSPHEDTADVVVYPQRPDMVDIPDVAFVACDVQWNRLRARQ